MFKWLTLLATILVSIGGYAQQRELVIDQFHDNKTARLLGMEELNDSESVLLGTFTDTLTVLNASQQPEQYIQKGTYPSVFIAKLNSKFLFTEVAVIDGEGILSARKMRVHQGQVFVAGFYSVTFTIDFDPGPGEAKRTSNTASNDGFLLELNNDLSFKQVMTFGGDSRKNSGDRVNDMAIAPNGDFILVGTFHGTTDFDPGSGTTNLTSTADEPDIYVARYNRNMQLRWARQMTGTSAKTCSSVALDSAGNLVMTGSFKGTVDFDPGPVNRSLGAGSLQHGYVVSLDSNGIYKWIVHQQSQAYAGNSHVVADETIVVLGTAGDDVRLGKDFVDTFLFPSNVQSYYMIEFDQTGTLVGKERIKTPKSFYITGFELVNHQVLLASRIYDELSLGSGAQQLKGTFNQGYDLTLATYNLKTHRWTGLHGLSSANVGQEMVITASEPARYGAFVLDSVIEVIPGGKKYKTQGTQTLAFGRFQVVCPTDTTQQAHELCSGKSIDVNGVTYTQAGVYHQTLTGAYGCDSALELTVGVNPVYALNDTLDICPFDSTLYGSNYYAQPGTYLLTLATMKGCDSTVNLTVFQPQIDTTVARLGNRLSTDTVADSIQWYDCSNTATVLSDSFVLVLTKTGNYGFTKWVDGCDVQSACVNHTVVGVQVPGTQVRYYTIGKRIEFNQPVKRAALYNVQGQEMMVAGARQGLNVAALSPGIYLLVFQQMDGRTVSAKVAIGG